MVIDQTFKGSAWLGGRKGQTLTFERSPQHQDHAKMNVHILGDAMAMQRQNDQKVFNYARAKAKHEWDKLVIIA